MEQTPEREAVQLESLNLLIMHHAYRETISRFNAGKGTRWDLHFWLMQLRAMENDIILRICRLDDDDNTTHSFREALRSVRSNFTDSEAKAVDQMVKDYRTLINPWKTKARNYWLAHLNKQAEAPWDPQGGLEPSISMAMRVVDSISREKQIYTLRVASDIPELNLRQALGNELKA
jgi:AbiU2